MADGFASQFRNRQSGIIHRRLMLGKSVPGTRKEWSCALLILKQKQGLSR
jgi:hypothetical protein